MKPKWGIVVIVAMVLCLVLAACSTTTKTTSKPLVIATDATWPPMEFVDENKQIAGFDIDLMNAIAKAMDFQVEFKNTAWDGIFAGLEAGE